MNLLTTILLGFKEIWAHKFRSLLTMLGIILGVSSLIAMSALVKGMENGMRASLIEIGGLEKVTVIPDEVPEYQRHLADQAVGITMNDVFALKQNASLVKLITPEMRMNRPIAARQGKIFRPWVVLGTWPSALEMSQHVIAHGRMFNQIDDDLARNVCVIGSATRDELFGAPEDMGETIIPIGEKINLNGQLFTIIGMFPHYESELERQRRALQTNRAPQLQPARTGPSRNTGDHRHRGGGFVYELKNSTILIPLNTMWIKFRSGWGTNGIPDPKLSGLSIKVSNIDAIETALQQSRNILMHTHAGIEDFEFRTQESWSENISNSIRNARLSGGVIAAISLIVGGIGIMNIMFASITERIREIGIRKAIGATTLAIFIQILVESVVIAVIGGLTGLVVSYGLVKFLVLLSPGENIPQITALSMLIAFGFSVAVGVLAGFLPAIKASRLDPIEALRYE